MKESQKAGSSNEYEMTLINEALKQNISTIFHLDKNGNNPHKSDEFRRTRQTFDKVKKLSTNDWIISVNDVNDMDSKNSKVVEELITILNHVFEHSGAMFHKEEIKLIKNLGENGQREYLLTKYLSNVESRTLRDFVKTKKNIKPIQLYKVINMVDEYEKLVSKRLNKNPINLSIEDLGNVALMESMITSVVHANLYKQLAKYLGKPNVISSHNVRVIQRLNHYVVNQYKNDLIRRNRSQARIERMEDQIIKFLKWLPIHKDFEGKSINEISVSNITRDHLLEYRSYLIRQSINGVTTMYSSKQHFKDIKTFFKRIHELQITAENIGFNLRNIQADDYFYRRLPNDDDMEVLFKAIRIYSEKPETDTLAFALMSFLGFRMIELHRLNWADVNLSTKTVIVHSKGSKSHRLPIPDVIYNLMKQFSVDKRTGFIFRANEHEKEKSFKSRTEWSFTLFKVLADWDIKGGPHILRHWFITNLARKKIDPVDLKTLARHDSLKTTAKYIHYYSTELRDDINQIDYGVSL